MPTALGDKIVAAHLFGQAQIAASAPGSADQSISVDGIVYIPHSGNSQAVLTINGKTEVYKNGATLPDGETLAAIGPSTIQLALAGATRQLTLNMSQYGNSNPAGTPPMGMNLIASVPQTPAYAAPSAGVTAGTPNSTPMPGMRPPQVPVTAPPLEQLQALRAQLVPHP